MIAGVVLAGGRSRRMDGRDKAFARLGGRAMVAHVVERLGRQVDVMAISANVDPTRYDVFGLPVVSDGLPGDAGPLAGLLAGLDWATERGAALVATAACDTPFFPDDLVARLVAAAARAGGAAAVATTADAEGGRVVHPTFGLWSVGLRSDLRRALDLGTRRVADFAAAAGAAEAAFDPASDPFFNVNTPADLARAEARLTGRRTR